MARFSESYKAHTTRTRCLREAGAPKNEIAAYELLIRSLRDKVCDDYEGIAKIRRYGLSYDARYKHFLKQEQVANSIGMPRESLTKALNRLCEDDRMFSCRDGRMIPVLTKIAEGHRGKCATFYDNISAEFGL